ncbi:MAG: RDD family protein [Acidobacteriota bacterium]
MTANLAAAVPGTKVKSPASSQGFARYRAPFSLRCGAILIDYIILVAILALSTLLSRTLGGGARSLGNSSETAGILVAILVAGLNLGVLPGLTGFTLGKWAAGLRILRQNGSAIGIGRALLRHFVGYPLSFITLGIGFLIVAFSSRGRGLHDLIAGTIVVHEGPTMVVSSRGA